jgi:hypothetical protein
MNVTFFRSKPGKRTEVYIEESETKWRKKKQGRDPFCVDSGDYYFDSHENISGIQSIECEVSFYERCYNQDL